MSLHARIFAPDSKPYIYIGGQSVSAVDEVAEVIESFGYLPAGWDYGRGGPIPAEVLEKSLKWNERLQSVGFFEVEAFPGEQEVLLAVSSGNHYFEFIIEADQTISIAYDFKRKRVFYRSPMTDDEAWQTILEILAKKLTETKGQRWSAFDYFTLVGTAKHSADLPNLHSAIPAMTQDYLLWSGTASEPQAFQLAPISGTSIKKSSPTLSGSHLSSGSLILTGNYLPVIR